MYNIRTINQYIFLLQGYKMENKNKLFDLAQKCRENAYAPYSGFKVGAAIRSANGLYFTGCNVENASYPCGTCAEAGAISAMIAGGERKIAEILIIADTTRIVPCGNCLQKIAEFADENTIIHSADLNGIVQSFALSQLININFRAEDMPHAS